MEMVSSSTGDEAKQQFSVMQKKSIEKSMNLKEM
jgi:hypothetical protein